MLNEIIIILILTILNGLFSMSEIAVVSSRKLRLEAAAKKGSLRAQKALLLHNSPTRFLSTVQIGITVLTLLTGMFGGEQTIAYIHNLLVTQNIPYSHNIAYGVVLFAITFTSLVLGELIPKRIGMSNPEKIAFAVAMPMSFISKITAPFIWLLSQTTELFIRLIGIKASDNKVTEEEIKAMIEEGAGVGAIDEIEQEIVENVFHLGDKRLGALMTPRPEIVWLDANDTIAENFKKMELNQYAVYPICENSIDNVLGMISIKDVVNKLLRGETLDLRTMIRTTNFLPENIDTYQTLTQFKDSKIHHALVVDEYGSTIGLVTMKDILDALIGDTEEAGENRVSYEITAREDGSWLIDAQYSFDDFVRQFDLNTENLNDAGFNTVGGFTLHLLERVPKVGEKFTYQNYEFEVIDMDFNRIDKLLVKKN
jgi:putative hemolysin